MIITIEQQEELKRILNDHVCYQETYSEVYDHVISALEEQQYSVDNSFENTIYTILDTDFGGISQLRVMEKQRVKFVINQIAKKQWHFALAFFKLPLIVYTALAAVAIYQLANTKLLSIILLFAIFVMLAPAIIVGFRMLNNTFKRDGKRSIRNNMFNMSTYGVILYYVINPRLITDHFKLKTPDTLHMLLITVLIMFYFIYGLSFIKMYRTELKMQIA